LTAIGGPLLGQACFSEWSLMAFFSGCSSISYGLRNVYDFPSSSPQVV